MKMEIANGVAHVDFNRPGQANCLDEKGWADLRETFQELGANSLVRAILLTGAGKHFCAGMDVKVLYSLMTRFTGDEHAVRSKIHQFIVEIQDAVNAVEACGKPVVAAIQGGCIGGGMAIATACDIRYATAGAYFTIKEVDFGIVADIGTLQRLPGIIPAGLAAELALTARQLPAEEAKRSGLIGRQFDDYATMVGAAHALCQEIAGKDPTVTSAIKQQLNFAREHTVRESLAEVARASAGILTQRVMAMRG